MKTCSLPVSLIERASEQLRTAGAIAVQYYGHGFTAETFFETARLLRAELDGDEVTTARKAPANKNVRHPVEFENAELGDEG